MKIIVKHRYTRWHYRGHVTNSFCQGKFKLSDQERIMYRAFGRLYKRAEQIKQSEPER